MQQTLMPIDSLQEADYRDIVFFPAQSLIAPSPTLIANSIVAARFILLKAYSVPVGKLIFALNLMNLCYCSTKLSVHLLPPQTEISCRLFEVAACFGAVSSMILGACFGHSLYMLTRYRSLEASAKYVTHYPFIGIIGSATLAICTYLTPLVQMSVAADGSLHCVHRIYVGKPDYTFIIFVDMPVVIAIVLSVIWYSFSVARLRNLFDTSYKYIWVLLIYPAMLVICWLPLLIEALLASYGITISSGLATVLKAFDKLQGFINAIVYWRGSKKTLGEICRQLRCLPRRAEINQQSIVNIPTDDPQESLLIANK